MAITSKESFLRVYSKAVNEGYAAIFAGAGLSMSSGYVDWKTLLKPFAKDLELNIDEEHDLARLAQYYRNEKGTRASINQEIVNQFSEHKNLNENINIVTRLPIYTYWTTNYDKLIEKGLEKNNRLADVKINQDQLNFHKRDRDAIVYKMHGDVDFPKDAVLTKQDYEIYNLKRPLFTTVLQGDLVAKTFLFIGFSFEDPNLDNILSRTRNILEEQIGENYWLEKQIEEPDYTNLKPDEKELAKERYRIDCIKQNLKINELQRYGINTVLIKSYYEITEILTELENVYLKNNVFISGSIEEYNDIWTNDKVKDFGYKLSKKLVQLNYKVYSGFGLGIGSNIINGALDEIYTTKYRHIDEHLVLRPFPQEINQGEILSEKWTRYREEIIKDVGIAIFIFGNKKDQDGNTQIANGMIEEFEIAKRMNKIIIPIGSTGNAAKVVFDEVKQNIAQYPYLKDQLEVLETNTNENELVDAIQKIIKSI
ncbi:SIR2 family protein [Carnobacterium maltaromaticum]|uniref:SIR2 family protein n=1 Tax=Carnobacterium maltaromaticum TaxID=2751 RepID=A0AAW9K221_CARML|nr:SIR2 family protein [Carnobacterium maltaromaticum]MDZ5757782.1 SIR2 family protein [Carnobacterium maltaromaticum]